MWQRLSAVLLCSGLYMLPAFSLCTPSALAASWLEMPVIPTLLNLQQGDHIRTQGLATGHMHFTALQPEKLQMHQQILLNKFARSAIEKVVGKKLSAPTNQVVFRFLVERQPNGTFAYQLFDQGNNELLVTGPVKVLQGARTDRTQELEFKAAWVKMTVKFERSGEKGVKGVAHFAVGVVPVPGSLTFSKTNR
jgi:hypothetical protein